MKFEIVQSYGDFDLIAISKYVQLHRHKPTGDFCLTIRNLARIVYCHPQTIKNYFNLLSEEGSILIETGKLPSNQGEQDCSFIREQDFQTFVEFIIYTTNAKEETKIRLQNFWHSFLLFKKRLRKYNRERCQIYSVLGEK